MSEITQPRPEVRRSATLVLVLGLVATLLATWRETTGIMTWVVLTGGTALSIGLYFLFAAETNRRLAVEWENQELKRKGEGDASNQRDLAEKLAATESKLREVTEQCERFRAVIEATTDLVAMASLQGETLYLNPAGRRLMEFPDDLPIPGHPMARFYPDDVNRFFQEVAIPQAMSEGFWAGETRLLTWHGREVPVSFVGSVVRSPDGAPQHLSCIARDVSERRRIEEDLRWALAEEKELNRLKTNFISMVTHEIRTPLALILGSAEIMSRYMDRLTPQKRIEHLRIIDSAVLRMSALMEDVLLFSKAEAGRMEFNPLGMDLKTFCAQLVDEIHSATNRRCPVELRVTEISEPGRGDENLLRHVFHNLLANAAKYSPAGTPVLFTVTRDGGDALFTVEDRGLGIPEGDRKELFTPFHRGRNVATMQGTGLGLVIVKHCVELHGGEIAIESVENAGTIVRVRVPLFSPAHTEFLRRLSKDEK